MVHAAQWHNSFPGPVKIPLSPQRRRKMAPQQIEMRGCRDGRETREFEGFLIKNNALDSSIDTESTCSTEIENLESKDSLSTQYDGVANPQSLRHRRPIISYALDEEMSVCSHIHGNDPRSNCPSLSGRWSGKRQSLHIIFIVVVVLVTAGTVALILTVTRAREFSNWRKFLDQDARKLLKEISKSPTGSTFTIRLKGSRVDLLRQSLDAYSGCSSVHEIQIDFENRGGRRFPEVLFRYGAGKATTVGSLSSAGTFLLDEGLILSCADLDGAFATWKQDPRRFVGFLDLRPIESMIDEEPQGAHSILSDRAAFVHRRYLEAFSAFDRGSCCESLLSVQVSLASGGKPPVLMKANPQETLASPAKASQPTLSTMRQEQNSCSSQCAGYMTRLLLDVQNLLPAVDSGFAVVLGSSS